MATGSVIGFLLGLPFGTEHATPHTLDDHARSHVIDGVFRPMIQRVAKFERMPHNGVDTVGQAVDFGVIFAVDQDDPRRNMAHGSVRFDDDASRNPVRVDAVRDGDGALHISVELLHFDDNVAVNASDRKCKRRNDQGKFAFGRRGFDDFHLFGGWLGDFNLHLDVLQGDRFPDLLR